jgi:extradiol dioxygenase family protein
VTRTPPHVFHLAIPARDLDDARRFYVKALSCTLARRYTDRITLNFIGDQLVCHLSDRVDAAPQLYLPAKWAGVTDHVSTPTVQAVQATEAGPGDQRLGR